MATEAGHPAWFLTAAEGYVGDRSNERTATGFTREGLSIKASFFPKRPPQPSHLWVHCPEAVHVDTPRILCTAGDLILFRVAISSDCVPDSRFSMRQDCDYFIYRADPNLRVLTLLNEMRSRCFEDTEVGILPRGLHNYTIAALLPCLFSPNKFELHLFHSETSSWTTTVLPVAEPQQDFDCDIPTNRDLRCHNTSNVITIGGEYGTFGWVDLWRGILFCDVLREEPTLSGIPLPLPMEHITSGEYAGRAMDCRGIAFVNGCLKFIQLDIIANYDIHIVDPETGYPTLLVDDWAISSWINPTMENSFEAWGEPECTVQASEIRIKTDMISHPTGMLLRPSDESFDDSEVKADYFRHLVLRPSDESFDDSEVKADYFRHLVVSDPSPSLDGDGFVYLIAREKLHHRKSFILALDMNTKTLQSAVLFGIVEDPCDSVMYCTGRSSSNT